MSTGPRLSHGAASAVASEVFERWGLGGVWPDGSPHAVVVGSLRRGRPTVGDIEIIAPVPKAWAPGKLLSPADDPLFRAIDGTMTNPWIDERAPLLSPPAVVPDAPMGGAVRGLKPGFLAASLVLRCWPGTPEAIEIPCQVYRYTERNRGWVLLMRTGPADFGEWFLGCWKRAHGIPLSEYSRPACVDNHLVDARGNVVPVWEEQDAFRLANCEHVAPDARDGYVEGRRALREAWR